MFQFLFCNHIDSNKSINLVLCFFFRQTIEKRVKDIKHIIFIHDIEQRSSLISLSHCPRREKIYAIIDVQAERNTI